MKNNYFLYLLGIIAVFLVIFFVFFNKQTYGGSTTISGHIDLNGHYEEGKSTMSIEIREENKEDFETVISNIPAQDNAAWAWHDAKINKVYEIKAVLIVNEENQGESSTLRAIAPAINEVLVINSKYQPDEVSKQTNATISGNIDLNGAVGTSNSISLFQKKVGETTYQLITDNVPAKDNAGWAWNSAIKGEKYNLKAVLFVNGTYEGESNQIIVTAPASNEMLRIVSRYVPVPSKTPVPSKASISGDININGQIPNGATVAIYKKATNDSDFEKIADNINARDGVEWSWNDAKTGVKYQLKATVWHSGDDIGTGVISNVAAPASKEEFHINIGNNLHKPPNSPTIKCNNKNGNNWNVTFTFNTISGAKQYWLEVGDQNEGNNIASAKMAATNDTNQTYTIDNVEDKKTYYAQYSYSECSNCSSGIDFSPFSNSLEFSCPSTPDPTATPTVIPTLSPYPTYTPYPTSTLTPSNTPIPTATLTPTPTPICVAKEGICGASLGPEGQCCVGLTCVVPTHKVGIIGETGTCK